MLTFLKQNYFHNKNYVAIYLHNLFDAFGKSIISIFSAVLLYKMGYSISFILLFFALQFGLMGLLSPLSPVLISKIGLIKSILVSNIFRIIGTVFLLITKDTHSSYMLLIFIFFSIDGAIYHPIMNAINSVYVKDTHKGKVNSLTTIFKAISIIGAVILAGELISLGNNTLLLSIIICTLILSISSYIFLLDKKDFEINIGFIETYKFLFGKDFRENLVPFGLQSFPIIERILIPLFIFISIGSFKMVSYIVSLSILVEFVVTFIFGLKIDNYVKKAFFTSTLLKSFTSILFLIGNKSLFGLFFNQIYAKITENIFENTFSTHIQTKAKKFKPMLFTTSKEMILCFSEFFILIFFAIIALFIGNKIFLIIFLSSFLGIWGIYKFWRE